MILKAGTASLSALPVGARATLGPPQVTDAVGVRLLEMGMTEGAVVVLTRRAPFGDPLEIELRGTRLCLRAAYAAQFPVVDVAFPATSASPGRRTP